MDRDDYPSMSNPNSPSSLLPAYSYGENDSPSPSSSEASYEEYHSDPSPSPTPPAHPPIDPHTMPFPYTPTSTFPLHPAPPPTKLPRAVILTGRGLPNLAGHLRMCQKRHNPPITSQPTLTITLEAPIHAGPDLSRISQIFTVSALSHASCSVSLMVAKFYDPFYFEHPHVDSILQAAQRVADETKAFEKLVDLQGVCVPEFYGCYSCSVPGQQRSVYVLLMQYIPGVPLSCVDPAAMSVERRKGVMELVRDMDEVLFGLGVSKLALSTRNTMFVRHGGGELGRWYGFREEDMERFSEGTREEISYWVKRKVFRSRLADVVLLDLGDVFFVTAGSAGHGVRTDSEGRPLGGTRLGDFKSKGWMEE